MITFSFFSCKKTLEKKEYAAFVSDPQNGLRKTQTLGEFELSVMYEPTDYILSKEFDQANSNEIEKRREELDQFEHFQFRIKLIGGGNILKYREDYTNNEASRINHFSFDARKDFILVSESDTMTCKIAHYSRNYNLTPTVDLSLTFDKANHNEKLKLIYTDSQYGIGKVKFLFESDAILNTPELKL